jgi:hypothetical protein
MYHFKVKFDCCGAGAVQKPHHFLYYFEKCTGTRTNPGQTNPKQTNPGQTNPGHDKPRVIVLGVRLKLRVRLYLGLG